MNIQNLPQELRDRKQWVAWAYRGKPNKNGKVPKLPINNVGRPIDAMCQENWLTLSEALQVRYSDGIGIVLTEDMNIVCIDYDKSDYDEELMNSFSQTYIERSVSGNGLHVFLHATVENIPVRVGDYEIYSNNRYIAMTGDLIGNSTTIVEYQLEYELWLADLFNSESFSGVDGCVHPLSGAKQLTGLLPLSECTFDIDSPIDQMRHNLHIGKLLTQYGYTFVRWADKSKTMAYVRRPNKDTGITGVVHIPANVYKTFSTSDELWELNQERKYLTSFDVWRYFECGNRPFAEAIRKARKVMNMPKRQRKQAA